MVVSKERIVEMLENQVRFMNWDSGCYAAGSVVDGQKAACVSWINYAVNLEQSDREISVLDDVPIMDLYKYFAPKF